MNIPNNVTHNIVEENTKTPDVSIALADLDQKIDVLTDRQSLLFNRLSSVTRPAPADPKHDNTQIGCCEISQRIYNQKVRVENLIESIDQQLAYLEI